MAGSASNWFKPTAGPHKGRVVYVPRQGMARHDVLDMLNRGYVNPSPRPQGEPQPSNWFRRAGDRPAPRTPPSQPTTPAAPARPAAAIPMPGARTPAQVRGRAALAQLDQSGQPLRFKEYDDDNPHGDVGLHRLARQAGFDGPPTLADRATLDRLVAAGGEELWRGIGGSDRATAADHVAAFQRGPAYYGYGIYGQGIYFASSGPRQIERRNARTVADTFMHWGELRYPHGSAAVRAVLRSDARVADSDALPKEIRRWQRRTQAQLDADLAAGRLDGAAHARQTRTLQVASQDEGYMAVVLGYDAIRVPAGRNSGGARAGLTDPAQLVVLNRTALVVEDHAYTRAELRD